MKKDTYLELSPIQQMILLQNIGTMLSTVKDDIPHDILDKHIYIKAQDDDILFTANDDKIDLIFDDTAESIKPDVEIESPGYLYENVNVQYEI